MRSTVCGIALLLVGLWIVLAMASDGAAATNVVVTRKGGLAIRGQLVAEMPDALVLRISGIETRISRKQIEKIEYEKSAMEIYAARQTELNADDLAGRFSLAREMADLEAYDLALEVLLPLRQQNPDHGRVQQLITIIEERQKLQFGTTSSIDRRGRAGGSPNNATVRGSQSDSQKQSKLLTDDQVNLIKLWELPADLEQARPRVVVRRDTLEKFFKNYASEEMVPKGRKAQNEFRALKSYQQLQLFFKVRARALYSEVVVRDDPPAMVQFRRFINGAYVARYFRRHFGQGQVPGLYLFGKQPNQIHEAYTNFYILSMYEYLGLPMIDRAMPQRSLLLQWGLPRDAAIHPAPEIEGWRPRFTGPDDETFLKYVDWITQLYEPLPNYGVTYQWPGFGETEVPPSSETLEQTNTDKKEDLP